MQKCETKKLVGNAGERLAAHHLDLKGYIILARKQRILKIGEIDLIAYAEDGVTLCFIEVKTRTSSCYGTPAEAVDKNKRARIRRMAEAFLYDLNCEISETSVRFDVIEVEIDLKTRCARVRHITDAF